jgi:hypothetical protein
MHQETETKMSDDANQSTDDALEVPDGTFQFLLEMTGRADASRKEHQLAEQLLGHLQMTVQRARQKIRAADQREPQETDDISPDDISPEEA